MENKEDLDMDEFQQIYHAIENEIQSLSYSITFSKEQKDVYSPKIADLVLRSASLLESALKYRFKEKSDIPLKYDDEKLIEELGLQEKLTCVHWNIYKFEKRTFYPFKKNEERLNKAFTNVSNKGDRQYSWNNAYQSLRHEFIKSIPYYGTLFYLFETLAALHLVLEATSIVFCDPEQGEDGIWRAMVPIGGGMFIRKSLDVTK